MPDLRQRREVRHSVAGVQAITGCAGVGRIEVGPGGRRVGGRGPTGGVGALGSTAANPRCTDRDSPRSSWCGLFVASSDAGQTFCSLKGVPVRTRTRPGLHSAAQRRGSSGSVVAGTVGAESHVDGEPPPPHAQYAPKSSALAFRQAPFSLVNARRYPVESHPSGGGSAGSNPAGGTPH